MKSFFIFIFIFLFSSTAVWSAENITGIWKTIDDETNEPKSLVQIYESNGQIYGRVIKLFQHPEKTATNVLGNPKIEGLDIIWQMKDTGDKWTSGQILDPVKGKIYACELWIQDNNLIVRGKIGPFGRNQIWILDTKQKSETENKTPHIPQLK